MNKLKLIIIVIVLLLTGLMISELMKADDKACSSGQIDLVLSTSKLEIKVGESASWVSGDEEVEFKKIASGEFNCSKQPNDAVIIMLKTQLEIQGYSEPKEIKVYFPTCSSGQIDKCDCCIAHREG